MYLASVMLSSSLVAVQAVVWCWGCMGMSLVVAVQVPWDIARWMLTVVHCNAGIGMSGAVSHLCTVHGCASGEGDCVSNICGCASATGVCWWHRVTITHCNTDIDMSGVGGLFMHCRWLCYHQWLCQLQGWLCWQCVWLCQCCGSV